MDTIDIHAEIDRINEAREALHMTQQQLADASLVPLQTVSRVLGHKTDNPTYATMIALKKAVGILDRTELPDLPVKTGEPKADLIELYRHMLERERIESKQRIAGELREYRLRSAYLKRTNRFLSIALAVVLAAIIAVMIIDATNENIGFFRYGHSFTDWLDSIIKAA